MKRILVTNILGLSKILLAKRLFAKSVITNNCFATMKLEVEETLKLHLCYLR